MSVVVKKFGGSSIETIELITKLADRLAEDKKRGDDIVVVVSAMAKTTDHLFSLAKQIDDNPYQRELDMLVTAGERISMSLLSIALHKLNIPAISFTGSQSGIITDENHGNARIVNVNAFRIKEELQNGKIVIVAGYQGVSTSKEVTTLGRGGSDTTAVALAGFLKAERCEMYKDVEGIFTADPKTVPEASKLDRIGYKQMYFLSCSGCKVIHPRAIELAMKYNIPVEVRSTFTNKNGTLITDEEIMDEKRTIAVTGRENLIVCDLKTDSLSKALSILEDLRVAIFDFEVISGDQLRFVVNKPDYQRLLKELTSNPSIESVIAEEVSSISFAGSSCFENYDLIQGIFSIFEASNIELIWLLNNPYGFTLYVKMEEISNFVKAIHKQFI